MRDDETSLHGNISSTMNTSRMQMDRYLESDWAVLCCVWMETPDLLSILSVSAALEHEDYYGTAQPVSLYLLTVSINRKKLQFTNFYLKEEKRKNVRKWTLVCNNVVGRRCTTFVFFCFSSCFLWYPLAYLVIFDFYFLKRKMRSIILGHIVI